MHSLLLLAVTGIAAADGAASEVTSGPPRVVEASPPVPSGHAQTDHVFAFSDGGAVYLVERGPIRGRTNAPVPGTFHDPATGRRAPVLIGKGVIVTRGSGASSAAAEGDVLGRLELEVVEVLSARLDMLLVESARDEDALELTARLAPALHAGIFDLVYPDLAFRHRLHGIPPNDPRYGAQFYLDKIDIEDAWAITMGSADVTVLVADNGCDLLHPDLVAKMDPGFDPWDGDDDPSYEDGPGNEHGTACAGIIAASTDNGTDIAGTCPECRLRCARLLPADGELVNVSADVLTFDFAFRADVDIVSNSWGFVDAIPVPRPLKDAIIDVQQNGRGGRGAVVAFASGNDSREIRDDELLAVPGVLGVGAVNNLGELTQFSNRGRSVDVVAPTGTITTDISGPGGADPGDVTTRFGGTSSACPVVAGVAGLLLAHRPELTADQVNDAIVGTARQSIFATPDAQGHDDEYGYGLVQPAAALAYYDEEEPPPPPLEGCACGSAGGPRGGAPPRSQVGGALLLGLLALLARSVLPGGARRRIVRRSGRRSAAA
jgi:serine protease